MFQPGGRGADAALADDTWYPGFGAVDNQHRPVAFAGSQPVRAPRFGSTALLERLATTEVCVDLGDRIGSREWWRGVATLGALAAAMCLGGLSLTRLPDPVRAPLTPAQAEDAHADAIAPLALGARTGRFTAPTRAVEALAEAPERPRVELSAAFRRNDSLEGALRRAGVGRDDANQVARMVGSQIRLDRITGDTDLDLVLGRRESKAVPRPLDALGFRAAFDLRLEVARGDDGALALKRVPIAVDATPLRISGVVGKSLAASARAAGVPAPVAAEAIQQLGYAVDFQHGVGKRDRFDLIVEHRRAATGETETGGLLYAALGGTELMRWTYGGKPQFFRASGESARKGLMRTPVDGAHLTSEFGMRFHPILNYSRLHQGVDFGVASGSPVMAAAGGTISFAGWHGGHGNYVMVKHNGTLATAYAHLSKFAVKNGQAVTQGQVIAWSGSTGLSTGPHLHYEVWLKGAPVNPMTLKFLGGTQLGGDDLGRFKAEMARLRTLRAAGATKAGDEYADAAPPAKGRRG